MSATPQFVQPGSFPVDLVPGKDYFYCSCGLSKNQPFCDGSHKGTGLAPIKFSVEEAKKYFLCGCKASPSAPFCDGTHRKEAGVKKYNEFLLKRNGELQSQIAKQKNTVYVLGGITFVAAAVAVVLGLRK